MQRIVNWFTAAGEGVNSALISREIMVMTNTPQAADRTRAAREARVLLVDDDRELCQMLTEYLNAEHFEVKSVHDGGDALARAASRTNSRYSILDVMLPSVGGFDVLRKLGASYDTPILMLTARGDDIDRIVGLELGADDYLSKPFNPRELVARMRAILRRATNRPARGAVPDEITVGPIVLNAGMHQVRVCRSAGARSPARSSACSNC